MNGILKKLRDLADHPDPDEHIFEAASEYVREANRLAVEHGVEPVRVYQFTNPLQAIAAVRRLQAEMEPEKWLLVADAAKMLSVSQDKVFEWVREGRLHAVNVANPGKRAQYRIPAEAIQNLKQSVYVPKILK